MLSLVFLIGMLVACGKLSSEVRKDEKMILAKEISDDMWTIFIYSIWFFAIPPLAAALFPSTYSLWGTLAFVCFYIPTIVLSRRISAKVSKGYDFERKAGRNIDRITWLGYAGIGLVILNSAIINVFQLLSSRPE